MDTTATLSTTVFLVEDSSALRTRLVEMLGRVADVTIAGYADTPESAIAGILRAHPDCVVLDIRLIGGSGIEVLRKIRPAHPEILFIVLTNHAEPQYRKTCMALGADYFFDKSSEFAKVREVIAGLGSQNRRLHPEAQSERENNLVNLDSTTRHCPS